MLTIRSHENPRSAPPPLPLIASRRPPTPSAPGRHPRPEPSPDPKRSPDRAPRPAPANDDDADAVHEVPLAVPFEACAPTSCAPTPRPRPLPFEVRQLPFEAQQLAKERAGPLPKRETKVHTVYGIVDPRTGAIGYVGETVCLRRRQRYHVEWTWERVEDVVRPLLKKAEATLARLADPMRQIADPTQRARQADEVDRLRAFLRATPAERVAIATGAVADGALMKGSVLRGPTERMPHSVKVWLAAMGEAGVEPRFVQLDRARGRVRVRIKETVWCHWLARSSVRLMNRNLDHAGHVAALRREHEALHEHEALCGHGALRENGAAREKETGEGPHPLTNRPLTTPSFDEAAALRRLMAFADTDPREVTDPREAELRPADEGTTT